MRFGFLGLALVGITVSASQVEPGLKIVARETTRAWIVEITEYSEPTRRRVESRMTPAESSVRGTTSVQENQRGRIAHAHIARCDPQKTIFLNYEDRTYMTDSMRPSLLTFLNPFAYAGFSIEVGRKSPRLMVETTTVQTGERRPAFGYTARRVITTRRHIPLDSDRGMEGDTTTDGWYIDLDTRPSCERTERGERAVLVAITSNDAGQPRVPSVIFKDIGAPERGYPIDTTTTWRRRGPSVSGPSTEQAFTTHRVVSQISREPLDPSLFEIPPGFRSGEGRLAAVAAHFGRAWQTIEHLIGALFR